MATTQPQHDSESPLAGASLVGIVIFGVAMVIFGVVIAALFTHRVLPEQASEQAIATDGLFQILLAIGAMVFFLVQGLLLISVIRFRRPANDVSDGPNIHGNTTLEIVWTIIPAAVVVVLAILSYLVWVDNAAPRERTNFVNGQPIEINVTGQRFAWNFEYITNVALPDPDAPAPEEPGDDNAAVVPAEATEEVTEEAAAEATEEVTPTEAVEEEATEEATEEVAETAEEATEETTEAETEAEAEATDIAVVDATPETEVSDEEGTVPDTRESEDAELPVVETPRGDEPTVSFTTSSLYTYVGQNVELQMQTLDVIHSFWVPAMRVKQDLLPGKLTTIRFTPVETEEGFPYTTLVGPFDLMITENGTTTTRSFGEGTSIVARVQGDDAQGGQVSVELENGLQGTVDASLIQNRYARYRLNCAELCGGGHGEMFSWVIVYPNEESFLENFYDIQVYNELNPSEDPVVLGESVITGYACAGCHTLDSLGWTGQSAPVLNGIADRAAERAAAAGAASGADYIAQSIRLPQAFIAPGAWAVNMPIHDSTNDNINTYMPQEELDSIVAFLCSQTASGELADSTCGLESWEVDANNQLADTTAVTEELEALTEPYEE